MISQFLILFLPLLVHCQRELDCGFLNSTFEFKDWDNVEKSYVGGCCTFECVKILDQIDEDWRKSNKPRAMLVSELYHREENCCNDTPATVGTSETSTIIPFTAPTVSSTTDTSTSDNTISIPTTSQSVSQEKEIQMEEAIINLKHLVENLRLFDGIQRFVNEPESLYEIAKNMRKALKEAEQTLEFAIKMEKIVENHYKNSENFETKLAEARAITEFAQKLDTLMKTIMDTIKHIADVLEIDIEDTWRRSVLRQFHQTIDWFNAPPDFEPIPENSIWFFSILLATLVFYMYFTI
ncbi:hypothetical protein GCK72_003899 [Caenorhabditis remanei]|uniref:Uncharacterized protein n=1 Tax=Caenorhabditis remanei TaxID=31234 RepID=A0A6A5HC35_CAERE|nr:hypothetical protein GCK72_003899 [Caenorhabditis remanei]KAF1763953.1 hypothetical protein GCK72_003899 [Caenorhabditis remanei]